MKNGPRGVGLTFGRASEGASEADCSRTPEGGNGGEEGGGESKGKGGTRSG